MTEAGGQVVWRTTVGDDPETITEAIGRAMQRADMVITTGGLGPTSDDVTKKAICKYFKRPLIFYDKILKKIEKRFNERGLVMPAVNQNQALLPQGAEFVDNPIGSAVGIAIDDDDKLFVAVPGVPSEMEAMTLGWITENIKKRSTGIFTLHRKIRTVGIIESVLFEKIADLIDPKSLSRKDTKIGVAFFIAGYNDGFAEQRPFHKPVQPWVALCSSTNNYNSRWLDIFLAALFAYPGK